MQINQVVIEILTENHSKKCMKIGHLRAIFLPWRRQVGKNLMRRTGKRIYRRFWISNQIFDSSFRSWDIHPQSSDFDQKCQKWCLKNAPYLENEKSYRKSDLIFRIYDKFSFLYVSSDFCLHLSGFSLGGGLRGVWKVSIETELFLYDGFPYPRAPLPPFLD